MPAPKSVEDASALVDVWIIYCQNLAIQEPKKAVSMLRSRATVLEHMNEEHMPEGWMFGAQHIIEKMRRAAREIEGAAQ